MSTETGDYENDANVVGGGVHCFPNLRTCASCEPATPASPRACFGHERSIPRTTARHDEPGAGYRAAFAQPGGALESAPRHLRSGQSAVSPIPNPGTVH